MSIEVIKGLALATRTDAFTGHLEAFLNHHLQVCDRAFVLIDHRPDQDLKEVVDLLDSFSPRVIFIKHCHTHFDNGKTCVALSSAIADYPEYDVVLHVDKDEFFGNIDEVCATVARIRAGESDYAEGKMVCRFAPGGTSYSDTLQSYKSFCIAAPVRADIIHGYGFPSKKCCLNRSPFIFIHNGKKDWKIDRTKFSLEHFRWINRSVEKTEAKITQHPLGLANRIQWRDRMVRERTPDFLKKLDTYFRPLSWEIEGWMDYEDLFRELARCIPEGGTFVELGVWKGRSISYFCEYLTLLGKKATAFGYDIFDPSYYNGKKYSDLAVDHWFHQIQTVVESNCPWNSPFLVRSDSADAAKLHEDGSVDVLWIDASHSESSVIKDIVAWRSKIKNGGVMAGHDIHKTSVQSGLRQCGATYQPISKSSWICHF